MRRSKARIAEGCDLLQLKAPAKIESTQEGRVKALWVKPQLAGEADNSGRPRPIDAQAEEECIPCQIIISAIGQGIESHSFENCGVPVVKGSISASSSSQIETMEGVFAGGDCVTGPSTAINAIAAGKVAAANIDNYLGYHHEIAGRCSDSGTADHGRKTLRKNGTEAALCKRTGQRLPGD